MRVCVIIIISVECIIEVSTPNAHLHLGACIASDQVSIDLMEKITLAHGFDGSELIRTYELGIIHEGRKERKNG